MPISESKIQTRRSERLEARISRETKTLCQKAAAIRGRSLTDFVVDSAVEAAKRVVHEHDLALLTRRDRIAFIEALLNPLNPNARLRAAARRHAQTFAE